MTGDCGCLPSNDVAFDAAFWMLTPSNRRQKAYWSGNRSLIAAYQVSAMNA
jgi:hypothetical protein